MSETRTADVLRAELTATLHRANAATDPSWSRAFAEVPRELFVPYFFTPSRGRPGWRLVENGDDWLRGVYSNDALVTQLDESDLAAEAARRGEQVEGRPTSSSSAPSLMAEMLHALDIADGMSVLEIGTGSGYNAALLAHRLGQSRVTSIEVDPALADRARAALNAAGYTPTVIVGDGAKGYPPRAPYDRVIATVALPRVPAALLDQTSPDALLLVPLIFAGAGGLMALLRHEGPGRGSGRFMRHYGGFMAVRSSAQPDQPTIRPRMLDTARPTSVPADALTDDTHPAAFYLSLRCPWPYTTLGFTPADNGTEPQVWGHSMDGSTFVLTTTDHGPRIAAEGPLWSAIETAYHQWGELNQPSRERFGITVDGTEQWIWLDTPEHPIETALWPTPR